MNAPTPKTYLLPEDLREKILGYLMSRPMLEVEAGVLQLRTLKAVEELSVAAPLKTDGGQK